MGDREVWIAILIVASIASGIFYVAFGQITVRKLRKNPETKNVLGLGFVSGWDIINVAQAFSLPRAWTRKIENSKFSFIYANTTVLFDNTTKFDRILGCIFYWLLTLSGLFGALLVLLNYLGVFNN
ncbi:hypothetical protein [Pseudocolwellia agarivorans]|uniref:hypothetical protein n=1 Tax=Pseudocolwellia agarivorans TaxID=1911682 RepID=UPI0009841478|nr:hypothetical protein [Pseudocolwellia agarivorans]